MKLKFNPISSQYETIYIKWEGIHYDRQKLKRFVYYYNFIRVISIFFKKYKRELESLDLVIEHYGKNRIYDLLNNDEHTSRLCHIERLSRNGALEILTKGVYDTSTYRQLSNLPKRDFDLAIKRIQELIKIGQETTVQDEQISENIPSD